MFSNPGLLRIVLRTLRLGRGRVWPASAGGSDAHPTIDRSGGGRRGSGRGFRSGIFAPIEAVPLGTRPGPKGEAADGQQGRKANRGGERAPTRLGGDLEPCRCQAQRIGVRRAVVCLGQEEV